MKPTPLVVLCVTRCHRGLLQLPVVSTAVIFATSRLVFPYAVTDCYFGQQTAAAMPYECAPAYAPQPQYFAPEHFEQFQSLAIEMCAKEIDVACDSLGISAGKLVTAVAWHWDAA